MFAKDSIAFVSPGQGSQSVGMASEFMENSVTKYLFEQANDTLGFDLTKLMREGSAEQLTMTENTQPALLLSSYAAWTYLAHQTGSNIEDMASYVAGHSLGEYSALALTGSLSFEDALKLVRTRGEAMQKAVPAGEGAMAAILGLCPVDLDSICRNVGCWIANDNSDGQMVISGSSQAIDEASNMAVMQDAKKVVRLDVSAPFHCPMMQPAADVMTEALSNATIQTPSLPVILNVTAQAETSPDAIRDALIKQVTGTVRWRESMVALAEQGITQLYELGSGKVLSGLAKRCDSRLKSISLDSPQAIDEMLEELENNREVA